MGKSPEGWSGSSVEEIKETEPQGWLTLGGIVNLLQKEGFKTDRSAVELVIKKELVNIIKVEEWVKNYFNKKAHKNLPHYHPDLITKVVECIKQRELKSPPPDWLLLTQVYEIFKNRKIKTSKYSINLAINTIFALHTEKKEVWIKKYWNQIASEETPYYHPDLVAKVVEYLEDRNKRKAPPGWLTKSGIQALLEKQGVKVSENTIEDVINIEIAKDPNKEKESLNKNYLDQNNRENTTNYHPDLVDKVVDWFKKREKDRAPDGWMNVESIYNLIKQENLNISRPGLESVIDKELSLLTEDEKQRYIKRYLDKTNRPPGHIHYHPTLIDKIIKSIQVRKENKAPAAWLTIGEILKLLERKDLRPDYATLQSLLIAELSKNPDKQKEWAGNFWNSHGQGNVSHFHPDLVAKAIDILLGKKEQKPPSDDWGTVNTIFVTLKEKGIQVSPDTIKTTISEILANFPEKKEEWIKDFLSAGHMLSFHYHLDLIKLVVDHLTKENNILTQSKKLKEELKQVANELSFEQTELAQNFRSLINIFGSSRCLDILYKFRPEFKGLPREFTNGILADYLGDFLSIKTEFKPKDLEMAVEFLSDVTFQDALYETIKDDCFRYYIRERRGRRSEEGQSIIEGYLNHMVEQVGHINNQDLDNIIQKVLLYYDSVLRDFHKPARFVEALSTEREFPDINQRINMKELADKKRLLIADEMGLGKSASVIMAKEQLGVKCALIVAPSNVLETWKRYLSDNTKGGYFKEGEAPRVLVVENPAEAKQVSAEEYDYILVSQERMTDRYADTLKEMNFDMMIVDEVHKFKRPEGVRSAYLTELTQKIEGENKYLALLSGTPVPNKIQDLGLILKLLYPEKFAAMDDRELIRTIVRGDILDLRSLLLPRMQMKDLQEGVEMPELIETISETELSDMEKRVYEVLLEDDELTATEKMITLRTFLMNPEVVDATPDIGRTKLETLNKKLEEAFEMQDKVVVFVNDYMEGIIWGEGNMVDKLSLPPGTEVRAIYGAVTPPERKQIEKDLRTTTGKMLLVVSGQTADVGVDFSSADKVIFYNEPWTEYQKRQEIGRVYRPGLEHDLESETLIVKETIEEGIHRHIQKKYRIIEKLLRGIPTTELEKAVVINDEQNKEPDVSINEELARYYFSSWDNLMRMFNYIKEIGEEDFRKFLEKYGKDYAGGYVDLGNRSYQSNANRITGTLLHEMIKQREQVPEHTYILDLASGPEMLKRHIDDPYQKQVVSIDINKEHFLGREGENRMVGSLTALPFKENSFDYANASLSFHYTSFVPSKGKFERLEVLREMNRILKPEGRIVINLIYSLDVKDVSKFEETVQEFGFKIVADYTGTARSQNTYASQVITLEKKKSIDYDIPIAEFAEAMGKEKQMGLKFKQTAEKIKDARRVVTSFELSGHEHEVKLNVQDQEIKKEEQEIITKGETLKKTFKDIKSIPNLEIIQNNFVRIRVGKKYVLFKKLTKGTGVVLVK